MNALVIVESPTKARTLQKFLGDDYKIEASMGHVRDLPKSELGVDVEHNFEPGYIIPRDKKKRVNELKRLAKDAKILFLATDPDREGEAIAWHLAELLRNSEVKSEGMKRVVFHEITEDAIKEAFAHPRGIDLKLVDAQQARRVLDRLVGYKLSPLLWQKIKKGLSAGRVQSVALKLIVEREKEIKVFKADEYWSIEAELSSVIASGAEQSNKEIAMSSDVRRSPRNDKSVFVATLIEKDGKKLEIKNKDEADLHVKNLEKASYIVSKITQKEVRRFPYPPFITSTLQQAASNKLGYSSKKTMMLAQALYEHGYISYMRTDSVNLSIQALNSLRGYIADFIGRSYLPSSPRIFKSKSKNAQEAHEAIRPTDAKLKSEMLVGGSLNRDHQRLYDLIWKRFVACQMSEAVVDQVSVDVTTSSRHPDPPIGGSGSLADASQNKSGDSSLIAQNDNAYLLRATGSTVKFDGWLKLYKKEETKSEEEKEEEKEKILPKMTENDNLQLMNVLPSQHFTEPPPRYNEASLIKKLEELGIGRPSTYAPIISTIQERYYVEKVERKFAPTSLGITVTEFLLEYFPNIVDYSFTAQMESNLDEIANGEIKWQPIIREFYTPFEERIEKTSLHAEKVKMEIELAGKKCPECGNELVIRIGKFGKFLACSTFPKCHYTQTLEEKIDVKCPQDGGDIIVRKTRKGKTFYGCKNWPGCKFASWTKPKTVDRLQVTDESKKQNPVT